ncbi:hypothetical protein [Rhizobium sp. G21]|uniref:hypothetical protein n=1 Tax=Rhizobium sp. G21 TaxID=2758439 RepID=UPI0016032F79|nr:hypothetical protein [Rhizobium sp. G21]MBB1251562.1 hypothetical protein [Rhizobium sp. G21]
MTTVTPTKETLFQRFDSYQPSKSILIWACGMTAVATMVVGFGWGGWVTGGSALKTATDAGELAKIELASAICVDRFKTAPDSATKLVELKALSDSYKRRQFIESGGWASMPGQSSVNGRIAERCSAALSA